MPASGPTPRSISPPDADHGRVSMVGSMTSSRILTLSCMPRVMSASRLTSRLPSILVSGLAPSRLAADWLPQ